MSAFSEYKKRLGTTRPWDVFSKDSPKADDITAENRYSTCKECPEFLSLTKQCKQCGCVMPAKVKLLNAECPIGKW